MSQESSNVNLSVYSYIDDAYTIPELPGSSLVGGVIKIRQKPVLSDDGQTILKKAGVFYETVPPSRDEESWFKDTNVLECIFLHYREEAAHFPTRNSRTVDSRSLNGKYPERFVYSSDCASCPMNPKNMTERGSDSKVPCKFYTSLLVLIKKPGEKDIERAFVPYTIQVTRSGFRNIASFINGTVRGHIMKNLKLAPYAFKTKITITKPKDQEYYVPVFPPAQYYTEQKELLVQGKGMPEDLFSFIKSKRAELLDRFIVDSGPAVKVEGALPSPSHNVSALPQRMIVDASFEDVKEMVDEFSSEINTDLFEEL